MATGAIILERAFAKATSTSSEERENSVESYIIFNPSQVCDFWLTSFPTQCLFSDFTRKSRCVEVDEGRLSVFSLSRNGRNTFRETSQLGTKDIFSKTCAKTNNKADKGDEEDKKGEDLNKNDKSCFQGNSV